MKFEDLVSTYTEFENLSAGTGMKLTQEQLEDVFNGTPGGAGLELAAAWSRQIGAQAAYWPQLQVAKAILAAKVEIRQLAAAGMDGDLDVAHFAAGDFPGQR